MRIFLTTLVLFVAAYRPTIGAALTQTPAEGTSRYYVALLRPDPNRTRLSPAEGDRIQAAHMANISAMAARGALVGAGPCDDSPVTLAGLFIFRVPSLEAARALAEADPTVVEHRNRVELLTWDGPVGIGDEYRRIHDAHPELPAGMGIQPFYLVFADQPLARAALEAHQAYVRSLRSQGLLAAEGPASGPRGLVEIVIFNRLPEGEADRLMRLDPAGSSLRLESHRWWCAANVLPWAPRAPQ